MERSGPAIEHVALAAACASGLELCAQVLAGDLQFGSIFHYFSKQPQEISLLVARRLAGELLLTMLLLEKVDERLVGLILTGIAALPELPGAGLYERTCDLTTARLFQRLGVSGVSSPDVAVLHLPDALSAGQFDDQAQALCPLAVRGICDEILPTLQDRQIDLARGICVAVMCRRGLTAARNLRWLKLIMQDAALQQFHTETCRYLATLYPRTHPHAATIGFHLAVMRYAS